METVLNAPMISYPLTLFDCCALSEGAAAIVLTRPDIAKRLVGDKYATIKALSLTVETQWPFFRPGWTGLSFPATVKAAADAYEEAGITDPLRELDFGVVHDCFTITELMTYQDMKLCNPGEAAELIKAGVTAIDGELPINPDGGLKCFGHPVGATGVRMIAEISKQVLGRAEGCQVKDARVGFAHNLGGPQAIASVAIVGAPDWKP